MSHELVGVTRQLSIDYIDIRCKKVKQLMRVLIYLPKSRNTSNKSERLFDRTIVDIDELVCVCVCVCECVCASTNRIRRSRNNC